MQYISTRGNTPKMTFSEVLLMGLAPDGGLMLPESYPYIDKKTLDNWRDLSYTDLAFEIMSLFATDIAKDDLKKLIDKTYTKAVFGNDDITPVRTLKTVLKFWNSPTVQRLLLKIWQCSFWAMCLNMFWTKKVNT